MIGQLGVQGHQVDVVSFASPVAGIGVLASFAHSIRIAGPVPSWSRILRSPQKWINGSVPPSIVRYASRRFSQHVADLCSQNTYDAALLEHIQMAQYGGVITAAGTTPVLRLHDVEAEKLHQAASTQHAGLQVRLYGAMVAPRMLRYEREAVRNRFTIAMTEHDRSQLTALEPNATIHTVPLGISCRRYEQYANAPSAHRPTVLFVGPVDYYKNAVSIGWFVEDVWPIVLRSHPMAILVVVNANPRSPAGTRLGSRAGVRLVPYVPDLQAVVESSNVVIAPTRLASGMSGRVLSALAQGMPTVATSLACRGIDVLSGEHLVIADDPEGFADGVCELIGDVRLARRMGLQARARVRERYDIAVIAEKLMSTALLASGAVARRQ